MTVKYWRMKSEPSEFSITDLKNSPNQTEHWDGVRNYQARNVEIYARGLHRDKLNYSASNLDFSFFRSYVVLEKGVSRGKDLL